MEANQEWKSRLLDKSVSCKQNGSTGETVATSFFRQPSTTLKHCSFSLKWYLNMLLVWNDKCGSSTSGGLCCYC